jgi:hypothetical protein
MVSSRRAALTCPAGQATMLALISTLLFGVVGSTGAHPAAIALGRSVLSPTRPAFGGSPGMQSAGLVTAAFWACRGPLVH